MCIYSEIFNRLLNYGTYQEISDFLDSHCKQDSPEHCPKICGGCDYLGMLDERLKLLDFIEDNSERCKGYAKEFFAGDLLQAGDYLLNQI